MRDDHEHPELRALTPHQRALVLAHRETFRAIARDHHASGRAYVPRVVLELTDATRAASVADNDTEGAPVIDLFNGGPL